MFRQRREDAGLSLREVARQTGINPGRLSVIERGVEPSAAELRLILACLDQAEAGGAPRVLPTVNDAERVKSDERAG